MARPAYLYRGLPLDDCGAGAKSHTCTLASQATRPSWTKSAADANSIFTITLSNIPIASILRSPLTTPRHPTPHPPPHCPTPSTSSRPRTARAHWRRGCNADCGCRDETLSAAVGLALKAAPPSACLGGYVLADQTHAWNASRAFSRPEEAQDQYSSQRADGSARS